MNRIRETLARLARAARGTKDESGLRLDRVGRTASTSTRGSSEKDFSRADGRGAVILYDGTKNVEAESVYPNTVGCIFLGTPHVRSSKRALGDCLAVAAMLSPNMPSLHILRTLKDSEKAFENQHSLFLMVSRDIKVICIREELPSRIVASPELMKDPDVVVKTGPMQLMVPRDSSAYDVYGVVRDEIPVNHGDLARFRSKDELGYLQIIAHISKIVAGRSPAEREHIATRNRGRTPQASKYYLLTIVQKFSMPSILTL